MTNSKTLFFNYKLPSAKEHSEFSNVYSFDAILEYIKNVEFSSISMNPFDIKSIEKAEQISALNTWLSNIEMHVFDIKHASGFFLYFKAEGIPDEPVESKTGQLFPNFTDQNWYNQKMFRFYAESIISKIFSILDNLGTILLVKYENFDIVNGKPNRKYFHAIISDLPEANNDSVITTLKNIISHKSFQQAKKIRNDIIHNKNPLKLNIRMKVYKSKKGLAVGNEISYKSSQEVKELINYLVDEVLNSILGLILNKDFLEIQKNGV